MVLGGSFMPRPTNLLYRIYEDRLVRDLDRSRLPAHVGVILDGHRRYARSEGLATYTESYRAGMARFEEFVDWAEELGIPAITAWVLSRENLARPADELDPYFDVLVELFERLPQRCIRHGVKLRFVGSLDLLPDHVVAAAKAAVEAVPGGERRLTIAMGYGGRQEIVDACRDLVGELAAQGLGPAEIAAHIDADALAGHLYSSDLPDPDLVIRTSGESRLSGFLLWQSAYAEFAFVDVYWPAFRRVDFLRSLRDYTRRERRFGK
jgi:short-chain Z-isoprenyl diphosphate synthase